MVREYPGALADAPVTINVRVPMITSSLRAGCMTVPFAESPFSF